MIKLTPAQTDYVEQWKKFLPKMWQVSKGVSKNIFIPDFDCSLYASLQTDEFCRNNLPDEEVIKKYS